MIHRIPTALRWLAGTVLTGILVTGLWAYVAVNEPPRILVFSKTAAFRHASIGAGQKAIFQLGKEQGFAVDTTENASRFTEENLKRYRAVVFLSTTGDVLNPHSKTPLNGISRRVAAIWAFTRLPIQNTTGPGITSWPEPGFPTTPCRTMYKKERSW